MKSDLTTTLQRAIRHDVRSVEKLAADCGVGVQELRRFLGGGRDALTLREAEKLCAALQLELHQARRIGGFVLDPD